MGTPEVQNSEDVKAEKQLTERKSVVEETEQALLSFKEGMQGKLPENEENQEIRIQAIPEIVDYYAPYIQELQKYLQRLGSRKSEVLAQREGDEDLSEIAKARLDDVLQAEDFTRIQLEGTIREMNERYGLGITAADWGNMLPGSLQIEAREDRIREPIQWDDEGNPTNLDEKGNVPSKPAYTLRIEYELRDNANPNYEAGVSIITVNTGRMYVEKNVKVRGGETYIYEVEPDGSLIDVFDKVAP